MLGIEQEMLYREQVRSMSRDAGQRAVSVIQGVGKVVQ